MAAIKPGAPSLPTSSGSGRPRAVWPRPQLVPVVVVLALTEAHVEQHLRRALVR